MSRKCPGHLQREEHRYQSRHDPGVFAGREGPTLFRAGEIGSTTPKKGALFYEESPGKFDLNPVKSWAGKVGRDVHDFAFSAYSAIVVDKSPCFFLASPDSRSLVIGEGPDRVSAGGRKSPHLRAFYLRLVSRGKARLQAVIAVMRKLLHGLFAMFRSNQTYDGAKLCGVPATMFATSCRLNAKKREGLRTSPGRKKLAIQERILS